MGKSLSTAKQISRTKAAIKLAEKSTIHPEHSQRSVQRGNLNEYDNFDKFNRSHVNCNNSSSACIE